MTRIRQGIGGFLLDLDGTVYRGSEAIEGASDFVNRLRRLAVPHLFVTNRANRTPEEVAAHLNDLGIPATPEEILTSAQATALHLARGRCYAIGETGLTEALQSAGIEIAADGSGPVPDAVVVGYDRYITYEKLETALRYILAGARFLATNPDPVITTESGISPENGAILAALEVSSGQKAEVVGKPERIIVDQAMTRLGPVDGQIVMLGDNLDTDIQAAVAAKTASILILTGISTRDDLTAHSAQPTWVVETYDALDELVFGA